MPKKVVCFYIECNNDLDQEYLEESLRRLRYPYYDASATDLHIQTGHSLEGIERIKKDYALSLTK